VKQKPASSVAAVYACRIENLSDIDTHEALRQLLRDPTIASKNWVYRQYDHTVRTGTIVKPGSDAAVFSFATPTNFGGDHGLQFDVLRARPARRRKIAVAEAARNLTVPVQSHWLSRTA